MKANRTVAALLVANLLLSACATGGGGSSGGSSAGGDAAGNLLCIILLPLCIFGGSRTGVATDASRQAPAFTEWKNHVGSATTAGDVTIAFDANRRFAGMQSRDVMFTGSTARQDGIEISAQSNGGFGLVANPYDLGWSYQSFGAWNDIPGQSGSGASSFGAATPGGALPSAGSARFTGTLAGTHVSASGVAAPAVAGLSVDADFRGRSLSLTSSGTTLLGRDGRSTAAPNLDLSGTLNYAAGSSSFAGTLTNAGRTMSGSSTGRFYGPSGQEIGGVFNLKSATTAETFVGGYGAKR